MTVVLTIGAIAVATQAQPEDQPPTTLQILSGRNQPTIDWFDEPFLYRPVNDGLQARRRLEDLVTRAEADSDRAYYMFRLAEIYFRDVQFFQQRSTDRVRLAQVTTNSSAELAAQLERFAALDLAEANVRAIQVLELAHELESDYRAYVPLDSLLHLIARATHQLDIVQESDRSLEELLTLFPDSQNRPEILTLLGDHRFNEGDWRTAAAHYEAALDYPESRYYAYALFRLGQLDVAEGNLESAFLEFNAAIDAAPTDRRIMGRFRELAAVGLTEVYVLARETEDPRLALDSPIQSRCAVVSRLIAGFTLLDRGPDAHELLLASQHVCRFIR